MNAKRGYLSFIAVFLSCLIISLPIYSANAYAGIEKTQAIGSGGVDGYINKEDYVDYYVFIKSDSQIDESQVKVANIEFDSCSGGVLEGFKCALRYPSDSTTEWGDRSPYTIYFYANPGDADPIETKQKELIVDSIAPAIKSFSITPEVNNGAVKLSYSVEDSSNAASKCSGIGKIEFRKDSITGSVLDTAVINKSNCAASDYYDYTYKGTDGDVKICAKAYDRMGHSSASSTCGSFKLDTKSIVMKSIEIFDSKGNIVNYLGANPLSVYITANISGSDLDNGSVKADLSSLGYEADTAPTSIETDDEITIAEWNVEIKPDQTAAKVIVSAADSAGNAASKTFTRTLKKDTTPPAVTSLKTGNYYNGKSYAMAAGNKFIAEISETESGINKEEVLLHISSSEYPAGGCSGGVCQWTGIPVPSNAVSAYISAQTKDRAGNLLGTPFSIDIGFNSGAPQAQKIEVASDNSLGYIATGSGITVKANVTDNSPVIYAYADLSQAVSDMQNSTGACAKNASSFICEWNGVVDAGKRTAELKFSFYNLIGNSASASHSINIYGTESAAPDFFSLNLNEDYLPTIDQQVADHLVGDYYYYTTPFVLGHKGDCDNLTITNARLTGDDCSEGSYVNYNQDGEDYNGFFQFSIDPSDVSGDSITVGSNGCSLEFNVICDGKIYLQPETETIKFNIPVGDETAPDDNLVKKIEDIKEEVNTGFYEFINTLDKYLNMAKNICDIKDMFTTVKQLIDTIQIILCACSQWPAYGKFCEGVSKVLGAIQKIVNTIYETITPNNSEPVFSKASITGGADQCKQGSDGGSGSTPAGAGAASSGKGFLDTICGLVTCTDRGDCNGQDCKVTSFNLAEWSSGQYCDKLKDNIFDSIGGNTGSWVGVWKGTVPSTLTLAKKSWFFAAGCFCIPGIVYNIKKIREIKCWKGYCYKEMTILGVPSDECDKQFGYQWCVYVTGQFSVFLDILASPLRFLADAMENPIAAAWTIARELLSKNCVTKEDSQKCCFGKQGWCILHTIMQAIEKGIQVSQMGDTISAMEWTSKMNFCDMLNEDDGEESSDE